MQDLQAVPPHSNQRQLVHVPSNLLTQSHVFVHHDTVWKLLQPLYDGTYGVISHMKKHFTIEIRGRHEVVPLDHLKPAYLDTEFSLLDTTSTHFSAHTSTSNSVTTTCSGKKFRWPSNISDQPLIIH